MIIRIKGQPKMEYFPKAASTAFAVNSLVAFNASGQIIPAAAGTTTGIVGVVKKAVASTDADYAATTLVPVDVNLGADSEFEIDANGTVTAAMVGVYKDVGADASTLAIAAATNNHMLVRGIGRTSTKARVSVNSQALSA